MYKKILVCLDNSAFSNSGIDAALAIAAKSGASVTGCHVYAARLHDSRFKEMEPGLPEKYQNAGELDKQRSIHDSLIGNGLRLISNSYMAVLDEKARQFSITPKHVHREGKNYDEIIKEASDGYDLIVLGTHGLGKTEIGSMGSVARRVARLTPCDALFVRNFDTTISTASQITAAIDGSPMSFGALGSALWLSKAFNLKAEAVSAFDPDFHYAAFASIAGVLTESAGKIFRFKEQEKLHNEIIDKGLAKIYQGHLNSAGTLAHEQGINLKKTLLSGKPFCEILRYAAKAHPFILAVGKTGVHSAPGLDIGSTAENCLSEAGCNVLISSCAEFAVQTATRSDSPSWNAASEDILNRIPAFARTLVKNIVEDIAEKNGVSTITPELMRRVREQLGEF
jgi:nucleotide-binding universal stress UspA family protein